MTWLNAALAFAITMLILSMVTSVFVETIHRFIGLRERGLGLLIGHVYDRVVAPYLDRQGVSSAALKKSFVELMTVNRAPAGVAGRGRTDAAGTKDLSSDATQDDTRLLSKVWNGRRLARLDSSEFMSRLGGSGFGDSIRNAIQAAGLAEPEQVLKSIAEDFDQFGREASVFFERRARLLSVLAALAVSLSIYVHPYELFHSYLTNPETALAIIAQRDDVLKQYEQAVSKKATVGQTAAPGNEEAVEGLRASYDAAKAAAAEATKALQAAGAPIGWTECRWKTFWQNQGSKPCLEQSVSNVGRMQSVQTLIWLLLGGLLVGLGGPFWYDIIKSLSSIRSVLGGPKSSATGPPEDQGGAAGTSQPQTPVDHFQAAATGRDAAQAVDGAGDDDLPVG